MNRATSRLILAVAAGFAGILWAGLAQAEAVSFKIPLNGAECKPPLETAGTGTAALTYDAATRVLTWDITNGGLSSPATQAHIHAPGVDGAKAVVVIWLSPAGSPPENPMTGQATLTAEQAAQLPDGQWWLNVHSQSHPACEIRGQVIPKS